MMLTILIDLDDTLLQNDFDKFLPVYLKELGKHLAQHVPPDQMIKQLLAATDVMVKNDSALFTLEKAFDQSFYPAIGWRKDDLRPVLENFYENIFPTFHYMTGQHPDALRIVTELLNDGHQIVIATNPLFPRSAILHRLAWAGLNQLSDRFALITSFERFHFAKPNPAYIAEILAQLGWPDQPAVMIGNNLTDDILPANQLGLPGYLVTDQSVVLPENLQHLVSSGSLLGVPNWLRTIDIDGNAFEGTNNSSALLARLKSTPAALDTLCMNLSDQQWQERPAPGQWSLTEIICHMRDVDQEINIPRFQSIVKEDNPFVAGINSDSWAEERDYQNQSGKEALREFIQVRHQMVEMLGDLTQELWQRPARHAIFGPTNLSELVSFVSTHDFQHIQSFVATIQILKR